MNLTGITWLDWVMAGLTVLGFAVTGLGAWLALSQAQKATTAAKAAEDAVATTRTHLMTRDMVNAFSQIREAINDATRVIEAQDVPVVKHVLVQLSEMLHRAVALALQDGTPSVSSEVIADLREAATMASDVKETIAKSKTPKPTASAKDLVPILTRIKASLVQFDAIEKYSTPEVPNGY